MKIAPATESVLIVEITDAIQKASFNKMRVLSFPQNWDDRVLNKVDEKFRNSVYEILDGQKFKKLIEHLIKIKILASGEDYPIQGPKKLINVAGFEDSLDVAKIFVEEIGKLPAQYIFATPILEEFSSRAGRSDLDFVLTDRSSIVSGPVLFKNFKTSHDVEKLDDEARGWMRVGGETCENEDHQLYFVYRASGFISKSWSHSILSEYFEELRSFYGLLSLNKVIALGFGFSDKTPAVYANMVHLAKPNELILVSSPESDIKECFNAGTRPSMDDRLESGEPVEEILEDTRRILTSEGARRFKAAAAWMLRAELSSRNLDKAIYASICLEVLLGDRETSDRIGLSKLMANRCAYSLGRTDADRKEIIKSFLEFYKLRSEIVHSGRTSMNAKERLLVNTGLKLAKRMLADEVRRVLNTEDE